MAGNTTSNTSALIRAEMYSQLILDTIHNGLLPEGLHRDVTDFMDGDTLHVPTFGDVVIRDLTEDNDTPVDALDTGEVTLTISKHQGAGSYLTDEMREDSYKAAAFDAALPGKHLQAIKESYETNLLATSESLQTQSDPNVINKFAHRFVASGTSGIIALDDINYMKLAFDDAGIPDEGRILIVDSVVEGTINTLSNLVSVSNNPMFEGVVTEGLSKAMRFSKNIYGFDIWVNTRLPTVSSESVDTTSATVQAPSGSGTSAASAVVCQAMCVADDTLKPYMGAWRRMPRTEAHRNVQKRRDEFYTTARWGFAGQRPQSLITCFVNAATY